mgnify:CR=1 FL=1
MNKDKALDLALKELLFYRDFANCPDWRDESQVAITAIKEVLEQSSPVCPKGLFEFACSVEDVDLICFLEYSPEEKGSTDYTALPYEPDYDECMTLNNAYIAGTDVDIAHMILQSMVDHIEVSALEKFLDR